MSTDTLPALAELQARAAGIALPALQTPLLWQAVVTVSPRQDLGTSPLGERWIIPITGGRFWAGPGAPGLSGQVLAGGADRQLMRADGVKELQAIYEMQTDDGALISVHNQVLIDEARQPVRYALSRVLVTAPEGPWQWLNRRILVGSLHPLAPALQAVLVRVYMLDDLPAA